MKNLLLAFTIIIFGSISNYTAQNSCTNSLPFCTGTTVNFPSVTGSPNLGSVGCLGSTPNPSWYHMQIGTSGNINIQISQGSNDVDFACWGPFTNATGACGGNGNFPSGSIVDCSYSTSSTENCYIPSAVAGQYYILLITNFSGNSGNVTYLQTTGTGATSCCILSSTEAGSAFTKTCTSNTSGQSIGTSFTAGSSYSWSPSGGLSSSSSSSPNANPSSTTTYTLTETDSQGCTFTDQVTVTVNNTVPNANAGSNKTNNCTTTTNVLNGSGGGNYSWSPSTGLSSTTSSSPTANPSSTTNYTLTVTNPSNGCVDTDAVTVTVNKTPPTANAGANKLTNCTTPSIAINGSGGGNYSWSPSAGLSSATASSPTASPASTTNYTLTVTNPANGCTDTDVVTVTVDKVNPTSNAGSNFTNNCTTTSANLSGSGGGTYSWAPSSGLSNTNTSNPNANPSATTNYTLTVTNPTNGCTDTDVVTVSVNKTIPTANAGSNITTTCAAPSTNLTATGGGNYTWIPSTGLTSTTTAATTATPSTTTTYTVTVVNPTNGCSDTDQVTVTVDANLPTANAGTDETTTCITPDVTLSGSGGGTYSWSPSSGLSSTNVAGPTADPTTTTTYTLTVMDPTNGCTATDQVTITVDETDPVANAGADILIDCAATTGTLTGTGGVTYLWNTPSGIITGSTLNLTGSDTPGTYTLIATAANGCTDNDDALVTIDQVLPISIAGPDLISNCANPTVTMDGTNSSSGAGITYLWTGPSITNGATTNLADGDAAGTYYLTVTAPNSCTQIDSLNVVEDTNYPVANAGLDQILDCNNTIITLDGSGSDVAADIIYSWTTSNGNITTSTTNNTVDADLDGNYTITVTNTTNGCISTDDVDVTQDTITPVAIITNAAITINCTNPTGNLDASTSTGTGNTFLWTTSSGNITSGANTPNPTVDLDGIYTLTITSANGCTNLNNIAEIVIIDTISPTISIGVADTLTCNIVQVTLDATGSQSGVTYQWTTINGSIISGDQTNIPIIDSNGDYILNIIAPNGCNSTASINVVNSEVPIATMIANPVEGDQPLYVTFTDSSSGVGLSYSWDFGNGDYDNSQNTDYTYTDFGEFEAILTITDQYGCSDYDTTVITVYELSEVLVPNIFSPNGDDVNDVFMVSGGGIKALHAQVLNRWGQIIYEWNTPFGGWDGYSFAGEESPSGSYFYFIDVEYNNGDSQEFRGNIVLVR